MIPRQSVLGSLKNTLPEEENNPMLETRVNQAERKFLIVKIKNELFKKHDYREKMENGALLMKSLV